MKTGNLGTKGKSNNHINNGDLGNIGNSSNQFRLLSRKNPLIQIFCICGWLAVPINPDKWSSVLCVCVCLYILYIYIHTHTHTYLASLVHLISYGMHGTEFEMLEWSSGPGNLLAYTLC